MIIQLNPPLELSTPKGKGYAWFLIDYGLEHNLMWVVAITDTNEIWTFQNPEVRATNNITAGRNVNKFVVDKVNLTDEQKLKCKSGIISFEHPPIAYR